MISLEQSNTTTHSLVWGAVLEHLRQSRLLLWFWLVRLLYSLLISTKTFLSWLPRIMTCLPRIMFPDAVARFRAIQTCYFYPGMRIRFTWTSRWFVTVGGKCKDDTNTTHIHKQREYIHTHTRACTRRHIPRHTHTAK